MYVTDEAVTIRNDTQMYNPTEPNNITSTLYLVEEIVTCLTHLKDDT